MSRFIHELRERGVIRATGLYLALVWLFLQLAEILFPAYDIPDTAVKYVLYGSMALLPVVLLSAWFFEITAEGLKTESEVRVSGERGLISRYSTLITVGVLVLALAISLFFNVQQASEVDAQSPPQKVSLLIADATNDTRDPVFEGALEQALAIGLESASFISSYPRHSATRIAGKLSKADSGLDPDVARLVALREGISLVILSAIQPEGDGYSLTARAINAETGDAIFESFSAAAENKAEVLNAVASLAEDIREALGEVILEDDPTRETFTAASIEAVKYYTRAQKLSRSGRDEEAVSLYEQATREDPTFGRAYSGWALSEFNLGQTEKARTLWDKTLSLMDAMSDRERYRTLGLYYSIVAQNYASAIENYELLVEKYPADSVGLNNLAVVYFFDRQFEQAQRVGEDVTALYPNNPLFQANLALYAMYAGQWAEARRVATRALELDANYHKAYLPLAMGQLAEGKGRGGYRELRVYGRTRATGGFPGPVGSGGYRITAGAGGGCRGAVAAGDRQGPRTR